VSPGSAAPGFLAALSPRWRMLVAVGLGAASALAFAPLDLVFVVWPAFTGLAWLLALASGWRAAFAIGWGFGFGQFVAGLFWIGSAFFVDAGRFGWLVPLPVVALPAGLALIPGLALAATAWLPARPGWHAVRLAVAWAVAEYARGHLLTGFPWNLTGDIWAASEVMAQSSALIGGYGVGLVTVWLAALPADLRLLAPRPRTALFGLALAVAAAAAGGGAWRLAGATDATVPGVRLRLVQAAIPQAEKWRPDKRAANLARHLQLSSAPGADAITHVIWPEAAVPYFVASDARVRGLLGRLAATLAGGAGLVITGTLRREDRPDGFRVYNSVTAIAAGGRVVAAYDKVHLVPFGEYLPARRWLRPLGLDNLAAGDTDFSVGTSLAPVALGGLPAARVLVCYEAIFGDEIVAGDRPGWLLNLTNDAWFGELTGPYQHFAQARARAVELGLPLVRAANTGISAIVDAYGRVIGRLGLGRAGVVDGPLPVALAPTVYARLGDWPFLLLLVAGLFGLLVACRKRRT